MVLTRIFTGLFLLGAGLITPAKGQEPAQQVRALMEICQFSRADSLAEHFLSLDSTRTDLLLLQGRARTALFRYKEAAATLQRALDYDSSDVRILQELLEVYRLSGDHAKAVATGRILAATDTSNSWFRLQLANLYYSGQDYQQACLLLSELYRSDSSSFYVAKQLGLCCDEMRNNDEAIRCYRQTLRINPDDPFVTGKLINVFLRKDEVAMALYRAQQYLAVNPDHIPVLKQCGYCHYLLIDFKAAAAKFRHCMSLGDSSKFTFRYLGLSLYRQEKYDSAAPLFKAAFLADTTDAEVCFYYGVSALRILDVDTALAYLDRAYRILMPPAKFLSSLYTELAQANNSVNQKDSALWLLNKAFETNPSGNTLRFRIAYQYDYHLNEPQKALPWYQAYLENETGKEEKGISGEIVMSMGDYSRNRIGQITRIAPKGDESAGKKKNPGKQANTDSESPSAEN